MLYISGRNETLKDIKEREGFEGSLPDYMVKFNQLNAHLNIKPTNPTQPLPDWTPVYPISQMLVLDPVSRETALEVAQYSSTERQTLREIQERNIEIPVVMAGVDVINDCCGYISKFRKKLDDPLITTPWKFWNDTITNDSIVDMIREGALYKATSLQRSSLFQGLGTLEANMLEMDALQTQLESIRRKKGVKAQAVRRTLQDKIKALSSQIKQQVYPKIENQLSKHLAKRYDLEWLKRMTRPTYYERTARNGKMFTSKIDLLNRTSLGQMRRMIPVFKSIGKAAGKVANCVGWASVGYDTLDAAFKGDFEKSVRAAATGSTGLWAGTTVTAFIIGAAGTTFLVATPFGWAIVVVGGIAAGAYVGNKTQEVAEYIYDGAADLVRKNPSAASNTSNFFTTIFRQIGEGIQLD